MNMQELKELLEEIAKKDLVDGTELFDHPCSVAVRALDRCVADIDFLRRTIDSNCTVNSATMSKRAVTLIKMPYDISV